MDVMQRRDDRSLKRAIAQTTLHHHQTNTGCPYTMSAIKLYHLCLFTYMYVCILY
jgi:hypothetical protein